MKVQDSALLGEVGILRVAFHFKQDGACERGQVAMIDSVEERSGNKSTCTTVYRVYRKPKNTCKREKSLKQSSS